MFLTPGGGGRDLVKKYLRGQNVEKSSLYFLLEHYYRYLISISMKIMCQSGKLPTYVTFSKKTTVYCVSEKYLTEQWFMLTDVWK